VRFSKVSAVIRRRIFIILVTVLVDTSFLSTGWGAMDPDSAKRPQELQVVDVNMVDSRKCEKWHRNNNIDVRPLTTGGQFYKAKI